MGYTTDFSGSVKITPAIRPEIKEFINKLNKTRRMKRNVPEMLFGVEGEFYVDGSGDYGQGEDGNIVDYNMPPQGQPGLWCQWHINEKNEIEWDGGEKFYDYVQWMQYIIDRVLAPNGYNCNGEIDWRGESGDTGTILIKDNEVTTK